MKKIILSLLLMGSCWGICTAQYTELATTKTSPKAIAPVHPDRATAAQFNNDTKRKTTQLRIEQAQTALQQAQTKVKASKQQLETAWAAKKISPEEYQSKQQLLQQAERKMAAVQTQIATGQRVLHP